MSSRASSDRWSVRRAVLIILIVVVGFSAAVGSWFLRESAPWWSTMLANIAVVVILLVPGELLLGKMRSAVDRVEGQANAAQKTAISAKETADKTERSLEDVREKLFGRQRAELDNELDIYRNMTLDPSRDSLISALRHAAESDLITSGGVRSPVWETNLHYRFVLDQTQTNISINLERDNGDIVSVHPWTTGLTADDFYQRLVEAVRAAGKDLGTMLNDPTQSVEALSEMLVDVTNLRSQELAGHRNSLRQIIERHHGWYFTSDYVIGGPNNDYAIKVSRLNEMDWEEHLSDKGWYEAPAAIRFARSLYRMDPRSAAPTEGT